MYYETLRTLDFRTWIVQTFSWTSDTLKRCRNKFTVVSFSLAPEDLKKYLAFFHLLTQILISRLEFQKIKLTNHIMREMPRE